MKVVMNLVVIGKLVMIGGPLREKDIMQAMEGCLIEIIIKTEELPEEVDPLMGGRPPDDGGPPGNGHYLRYPGERGPPGPPGPPGPV